MPVCHSIVPTCLSMGQWQLFACIHIISCMLFVLGNCLHASSASRLARIPLRSRAEIAESPVNSTRLLRHGTRATNAINVVPILRNLQAQVRNAAASQQQPLN